MNTRNSRLFLPLLFLLLLLSAHAKGPEGGLHTRNILFVMTDGLRWQEVFHGADEALMVKENGIDDSEKAKFWQETPEARRELLMPFLWRTVAAQGQVFGNQDKGSVAVLTNGLNFSYPGYSETFCGFADPRINSNAKKPNPNVTVLEWLNGKSPYRGEVAAFGAWDVFPSILNRRRCGFLVNAGYEPMEGKRLSPTMALLNRLKQETIRYWGGEPFDSLTFETAFEYFKTEKPRILYLSLGETDEWAHGGRYDLYLESARNFDAAVKTLWETAQSMPRYRGKTTLILATDHGRGLAPDAWKGHGQDVQGSEAVWMAFMGPDTPALGERTQTEQVTQSQIASTLAAFLGEDYCAAVPQAGKPILDVVGR
ncbi:MAG: alkaline phosphatase family protein [Candidatus Hydrogenedentes bacterium]|nr:alkaline phosphatase family protein [Candidatus Hydrogenedentota bacterium]